MLATLLACYIACLLHQSLKLTAVILYTRDQRDQNAWNACLYIKCLPATSNACLYIKCLPVHQMRLYIKCLPVHQMLACTSNACLYIKCFLKTSVLLFLYKRDQEIRNACLCLLLLYSKYIQETEMLACYITAETNSCSCYIETRGGYYSDWEVKVRISH